MLTEKDYCDYDTCVALKELGYKVPTSAYYMPNNNQLIFVSNPYRGGYVIDCFYSHNSLSKDVMTANYIDAPTMWEAQQWLRKEKNIIVEVTFSPFGYFASIYTNVRNNEQEHLKDAFRLIWDNRIYPEEEYEDYESTLLMGIKTAVKLLKEE